MFVRVSFLRYTPARTPVGGLARSWLGRSPSVRWSVQGLRSYSDSKEEEIPVLLRPRLTVCGLGGAGGNTVNNMIRQQFSGVDFVVANTDAQALQMSHAAKRVQLGARLTGGLGAGAQPGTGRDAANEALEELFSHIGGSHMLFITAGMGGGTGTGAAPIVAQAARERGILTVAIVTRPFNFEGRVRAKIAEDGLRELAKSVDTLIVIPNQKLLNAPDQKLSFQAAFELVDKVLFDGIKGITDLIVVPGLINLDFADVRSIMAGMGRALMGTGEAEGRGRAKVAAEMALNNPLLEDVDIKHARGVLLSITGGSDLTLFEVDEIANTIAKAVDPEANIIFGSSFDESLVGKVKVSLIVTGMDKKDPPKVEGAKEKEKELREKSVSEAPHAEVTSKAQENFWKKWW